MGEMDFTRVNPYRFGQGQPPVHTAWFQPRWPTAVTQCRGAIRDLPLTRWTTSTRPKLRRGSGDGNGMWRGQNEGSVILFVCWNETFSACSDHCRTGRARNITQVPGTSSTIAEAPLVTEFRPELC